LTDHRRLRELFRSFVYSEIGVIEAHAQHVRCPIPVQTGSPRDLTTPPKRKRGTEGSVDQPLTKRHDCDGLLAASAKESRDDNIHVVKSSSLSEVHSKQSPSGSESTDLYRKLGFVFKQESGFSMSGLPMNTTSSQPALDALHKVMLDSIESFRYSGKSNVACIRKVKQGVTTFVSSFGEQLWPSTEVQRPDFIDAGCELDGVHRKLE
jgi:hypothetical protein